MLEAGHVLAKKDSSTRLLLEDAVWNSSGDGIFIANAFNLEQVKSHDIANVYLVKPKVGKSKDQAKSKVVPLKSTPHKRGVSAIGVGNDDISLFSGGFDKSIVCIFYLYVIFKLICLLVFLDLRRHSKLFY